LLFLFPIGVRGNEGSILELPGVILSGIPFDVRIIPTEDQPTDSTRYILNVTTDSGRDAQATSDRTHHYEGFVSPDGPVTIEDIVVHGGDMIRFSLELGGIVTEETSNILPGWISILPPLIAIVLAIAFRQVVLSLFLGIWVGTFFLHDLNPLTSFFRSIDTIVVDALIDRSHVEIILFSLMLGGMVGLITRNGGTAGIIDRVRSVSTSVARGQVTTWAMGIFIFFDDYANTLIVGNTMRPITDRLRISREKLSYIVDATAAPVSSLAVISTWIGFEVGLISDALGPLDIDVDAYLLFLETIPYRFYPLLSLFFVLLVAITGRDFGPMLRAERRSHSTGKVMRDGSVPLSNFEGDITAPPEGTPLRWINAVLPISIVVAATMAGLWIDGCRVVASKGMDPAALPIRQVITEANTFDVLLWASTLGVLSAMVLSLSQRILSVSETFDAWVSGIRSMLMAMIVLVLAWSIGSVCEKIGTAEYVIHVSRGLFSPHLLPALTFLISAVISFSTGTSWATMAIVIPIVTPLSFNLCGASGFPPDEIHLNMVSTLSGVLAGSIFGDHCSPISDTTIMSSMASSVDHVDHVRTQLPYALLVGCVSILFGDIPSGYGVHPGVSLVFCCLILVLILRFFGKKVETER
jgi:Na+/H+ antiporter NhaC